MSANLLGKRLKQAREAAGLGLRSLAQKIDVSHTAISKYEKGIIAPSSSTLIKLAQALDIPIEHLFRPESIRIGPISFRKKSTLPIKAQRRIEYQVRDKLERRLELENSYPKAPTPAFDPSKLSDTHITSEKDLEKLACNVRSSWKLGQAPIHDLVDVLESHGIRVIEVDSEESKFDGLFFSADGQPVIVISKYWPGDRQRFTLAHELGHLLLNKKLPPDIKEEVACNRFAGAFLFPEPAVKQEFGATRSSIELRELLLAKEEFGISMLGILYRLQQTGIIKESLFVTWCKRFNFKGWRKKEPGAKLPPEVAHVFEQMLFHALGEGYIGESKAAELLGVSIESFRQLRQVNECAPSNYK